jgi:hypothetical protein
VIKVLELLKKIKFLLKKIFQKIPDPSTEQGFIDFIKFKNKEIKINDIIIDKSILGKHNLGYLTHIDLSYCQLDMIPKVIFRLKYLKSISLRGNNISRIPDEFIELTNLEFIDFGFNKIKTIPPYLCEMNSLNNMLSFENNWIEGNPLHTPSIDIAEAGLSEIAKYYYTRDEL